MTASESLSAAGALLGVVLLMSAFSVAAHTTSRLVVDGPGEGSPVPVQGPFEALPPAPQLDPALVALGARLFEDQRLSALGEYSCASCHQLPRFGSDALVRARLQDGRRGLRNTPGLYNLAYAFWFNWDGRYRSLRALILAAIEDPDKLDSDWARIELIVASDPEYRQQLTALGQSAADRILLVRALEAFVLSLRTPDTAFDRFLAGDENALPAAALRGMNAFLNNGCSSCHNGVNLGGNMLQRSHMLDGFFSEHKEVNEADVGRFQLTGKEGDRYLFRVPILRNVTATAPYFHDGSLATLEHAIEEMGEHQVGIDLSDQQIDDIKAFLESLSGEPERP